MTAGAAALDELIAAVAADLEDVSAEPDPEDPSVTRYRRRESLFARASRAALEVRLPEDIGEAVLRTPGTSAISAQEGWLRFEPTPGELNVEDRAGAWFRTAWRYAAH